MFETPAHPVTGLSKLRPVDWPLLAPAERREWIAAARAFDIDPEDMTLAARPPQITIDAASDTAWLDADLFDRDEHGKVRLNEQLDNVAYRTVRVTAQASAVREAIANA